MYIVHIMYNMHTLVMVIYIYIFYMNNTRIWSRGIISYTDTCTINFYNISLLCIFAICMCIRRTCFKIILESDVEKGKWEKLKWPSDIVHLKYSQVTDIYNKQCVQLNLDHFMLCFSNLSFITANFKYRSKYSMQGNFLYFIR